MAILRCLEVLGDSQPAEIRSDSKYSIQCVTEWYVKWEMNGWKAGGGGDVKNVDIIKPIRARLEARERKGVRTQFIWVKGHSTDPGNNAADELAVAGARML
ncbi:Ribonuclease H-like domain containing protein [Rhypophila decipiens]